MTAGTVGEDPAPQGPDPGGGRGPGRRLLTALVVLVLIAVPLGYLVVSAQQSRDSGRQKQRMAAAEGLVAQWPSRVQRRIYDVPIPGGATDVAFYETNAWEQSSLYVRFGTVPWRLDRFLENIGTDRSALRAGAVTITEKQAGTVGWELRPAGQGDNWAGIVHRQPGSAPDVAVTVDFSRADHPRVYVVSTVRF